LEDCSSDRAVKSRPVHSLSRRRGRSPEWKRKKRCQWRVAEAERAAIRAYLVRSGIPQLVDPGHRSGIEVQTVGRGRDLALLVFRLIPEAAAAIGACRATWMPPCASSQEHPSGKHHSEVSTTRGCPSAGSKLIGHDDRSRKPGTCLAQQHAGQTISQEALRGGREFTRRTRRVSSWPVPPTRSVGRRQAEVRTRAAGL